MTSFQIDPPNPDYFIFYTGNAASGHNYGLESDVEWRAIDRVTLGADLGLLQTYFEDFVQQGPTGATIALCFSRSSECAALAGSRECHLSRSARALCAHRCHRHG